jgi:hypothetical protein
MQATWARRLPAEAWACCGAAAMTEIRGRRRDWSPPGRRFKHKKLGEGEDGIKKAFPPFLLAARRVETMTS